jgi:hypothetical protein
MALLEVKKVSEIPIKVGSLLGSMHEGRESSYEPFQTRASGQKPPSERVMKSSSYHVIAIARSVEEVQFRSRLQTVERGFSTTLVCMSDLHAFMHARSYFDSYASCVVHRQNSTEPQT